MHKADDRAVVNTKKTKKPQIAVTVVKIMEDWWPGPAQ